jgi:hypothetical protein
MARILSCTFRQREIAVQSGPFGIWSGQQNPASGDEVQRRQGKRLVKSPKVSLPDSGMLSHLMAACGQ